MTQLAAQSQDCSLAAASLPQDMHRPIDFTPENAAEVLGGSNACGITVAQAMRLLPHAGKAVLVEWESNNNSFNWGECEGSHPDSGQMTFVLKGLRLCPSMLPRENEVQLGGAGGESIAFYSYSDSGMSDLSKWIKRISLVEGGEEIFKSR